MIELGLSPLETVGLRVVAANSFVVGQLAALQGGAWVLADNAAADTAARGLVTAATPDDFWISVRAGEVSAWPEHGLGAAGSLHYLGTGGATVSSRPSGPAVRVVQLCLMVIDDDLVQLFPHDPFIV